MVRKHPRSSLLIPAVSAVNFFYLKRLRLLRGKNLTADKKGMNEDERRWGNTVEPFRARWNLIVVEFVSGQTSSNVAILLHYLPAFVVNFRLGTLTQPESRRI